MALQDLRYERIDREVLNLATNTGRSLKIKLAVALGSKNRNNNKQPTISSYEYKSNKYSNVNNLRGISINSKSYLILEYKNADNNNEKVDVFFSYPHLAYLSDVINKVNELFMQPDIIDPSGDKLNEKYNKDFDFTAFNNASGIEIKITPTAFIDNNGMLYAGANIMVGNYDRSLFVEIENIATLAYFLSKFSLFEASQQLINTAIIAEGFLEVEDGFTQLHGYLDNKLGNGQQNNQPQQQNRQQQNNQRGGFNNNNNGQQNNSYSNAHQQTSHNGSFNRTTQSAATHFQSSQNTPQPQNNASTKSLRETAPEITPTEENELSNSITENFDKQTPTEEKTSKVEFNKVEEVVEQEPKAKNANFQSLLTKAKEKENNINFESDAKI